MRRVWLIAIALLISIPLTSAEQVKGGGFNVSFNLGTIHDVSKDNVSTGNMTFTISTLEGNANVVLSKSQKTFKDPASELKKFFVIYDKTSSYSIQDLNIDGQKGALAVITTSANPQYLVVYFPDMHDGASHTFAFFLSTLPLLDTADLIRSFHVQGT